MSKFRAGTVLSILSTVVLCARIASAVIIAGPDGSINTTPPAPDPGFANVGTIYGLSGVYVGNGWVLTANHVGSGPIVLGGVTYPAVPNSKVRFTDLGAPATDADLIAFKLVDRPPLPDLTLATGPVSNNDEVIMIGQGLSRGAETTFILPGPPAVTLDGWEAVLPRVIRWGTNHVAGINLFELDTQAFGTVFDELNGPNKNDPEAQVIDGDSGGAAFHFNGGSSELVGIIYARGYYSVQGQFSNTAIFTNTSLMADLDYYRPQILAVIDQPDCSDGLDEDADGVADYPADPGCDDALDDDEHSDALPCDNGLDDDMDGLFDFPEDDGCDDLLDASEVPEPGLAVTLFFGVASIACVDRLRRRSRACPSAL